MIPLNNGWGHVEICRFPPSTFVSLIAAIQPHLKLAPLQEQTWLLSVNMLPKPVSKGSLSCQRSSTLAAPVGHQRQKKTVMLFILAHLKPAMGIMHLKRNSGGIKTDSGAHTNTHGLIFTPAKHTPKVVAILINTHSTRTHVKAQIFLPWSGSWQTLGGTVMFSTSLTAVST